MKDEELVKVGEKVVKGRGSKNNFPNSRAGLIQTNEDRAFVSKLIGEVLVEYRQPKVKTADELTERLDDYFSRCAQTGQVPTVEEMCMTTGYAQSTIWDWENGRCNPPEPRMTEIIKKSKGFLKTFDAKLVVSGKLNFLAYCFRAKNYYDMNEKSEIILTPNTQQSDDPASLVQAAKMLPEGTDK